MRNQKAVVLFVPRYLGWEKYKDIVIAFADNLKQHIKRFSDSIEIVYFDDNVFDSETKYKIIIVFSLQDLLDVVSWYGKDNFVLIDVFDVMNEDDWDLFINIIIDELKGYDRREIDDS